VFFFFLTDWSFTKQPLKTAAKRSAFLPEGDMLLTPRASCIKA